MDRPKIPVDLILAKLAADAEAGQAPPGKSQGYFPRPPGHGYWDHPV